MEKHLHKIIHRNCGTHVGYTDDTSALRSDPEHLFLLNKKTLAENKMDKGFYCVGCGAFLKNPLGLVLER